MAHGTGKHLATLRLAADVHEAHGHAANRDTRSIFEDFVFAHDPEALEKGPESRAQAEKQCRRGIVMAAHVPVEVREMLLQETEMRK